MDADSLFWAIRLLISASVTGRRVSAGKAAAPRMHKSLRRTTLLTAETTGTAHPKLSEEGWGQTFDLRLPHPDSTIRSAIFHSEEV